MSFSTEGKSCAQEKNRFRFVFCGRVQGVGFRYSAMHIATALGLSGWVYNEWDGSVVAEVQGYAEAIDNFVARLEARPFIEIVSVKKTPIPLESGERSFYIRD